MFWFYEDEFIYDIPAVYFTNIISSDYSLGIVLEIDPGGNERQACISCAQIELAMSMGAG